MKFHVFQETRQGARHSNQDRVGYLYTQECALLLVCDGMGGHHRGEFAAEFIVHYLAKAFKAAAQPRLKDPVQFLSRMILAAHEALLKQAAKEGMHEVPRTTCVAAVIQDGKAYWAHVGDSRLYLIREGHVHKRTVDHSHVQSLLDAGKITQEQAAVHPERNKIYNCIGQPVPPRIDVQKGITLNLGDTVVLSSDGFWGPVPMELVASMIESSGLGIGIPMVMDLSEAVSGRECDNLSAVGLKWLSQDGMPVPEDIDPSKKTVSDSDISIALQVLQGAISGKSAFTF